jgi:hypothetical protein
MAPKTSTLDSKFLGAHQRIAFLLLAGLLALRLPLLGGVRYFNPNPPYWLDPVFQVGTYTLTARRP